MTHQVITISDILNRWTGPRTIIRTFDDPPTVKASSAQKRRELLALLSVPRTIPELAAECACMVDTMTKRVMHLERAGLVRRTGSRGRGRGLPLRWIAVEAQA